MNIDYIKKEIKHIQETLEQLKTEGRNEIAEMIRKAREHGDLSENSEYDDAKDQQSQLEARIKELEDRLTTLSNAREGEDTLEREKVSIGSNVSFSKEGEKNTATIVPKGSGDPLENKISADSALGCALLGKKVGETFSVALPSKTIEGKILSIV